ncbi:gliding motility-associated C-terminal domain-containing protein [Flavobacterium sp. NG2]|uniref:T9SS type B sorting domain-containing protein n=1 Tax=Flavobacterium sp. NG2 TaxID=3097547 RepID=UPI002A82BE73|nr:gliding motility-associated C-terminal domain-containing protein [Flavobacterium sp. NG2]WPR72680.1 gliding motility-associated C-terminal domain-containing protein [Flavobacterium sp. NG2]
MKITNLKKIFQIGILLIWNFSWTQNVKVELTFTYLNSVTKTYTVADLKVIDLPSGSTATWYDTLTGGNALLPTTPLQSGKTYYLQTTPIAPIGTRLQTIVYEISPTISANKSNPVCAGNVVKITANNILSEEQFTAENTNGKGLNLIKITQFGNSTYYIKPTAMTWEDANTLISSIPGASMYIINSQLEEATVYTGLQSKGYTGDDNIALWLGLKQYENASDYSEAKDTFGGWYWINGTKVTSSYNNWSATEPNNYYPNPGVPPGYLLYQNSPGNIEGYAQFEFQNRGAQWNDAGNTNVHFSYPIFEFTATTGLQWYKLNTTTNLYEIISGETKADLTITATAGSQKYRLDMLTNGITLQLFYEVIADAIPTTPTGKAIQNFCSTQNPIVANLTTTTGTNISWYATETGTTALNSSTKLTEGDYWAEAKSTNGCPSPSRLKVSASITTAGDVTVPNDEMEFCPAPKIPTIADLIASTTEGNSIFWYETETGTTSISQTTELKADQIYWAASKNDGTGCENPTRKSITIKYKCPEDVIYTGFSPNDDGVNDTYSTSYIKNLYPNFTIEIFNRWGRTVYKGNANTPEWNGRKDGTGDLVPVGVYYFLITFNIDGKEPTSGELYLSR